MEKLSYKDFKIGQTVICVKYEGFYNQHLTIGKSYEIEDLDFHFHQSLCIRSDNGKTPMFMPIKYFSDVKIIRKKKLDKINKS